MTTAQHAAFSHYCQANPENVAVKLGTRWTVRDLSLSVMEPFHSNAPLFPTKTKAVEYFCNLVRLRRADWMRQI